MPHNYYPDSIYATVREAMSESIAHWQRLDDNPLINESVYACGCALCQLFTREDDNCIITVDRKVIKCPIYKYNGVPNCGNTPYIRAKDAVESARIGETGDPDAIAKEVEFLQNIQHRLLRDETSPSFPASLEIGGSEVVCVVSYDYTPEVDPNLSGDPDNWTPGEPELFEAISLHLQDDDNTDLTPLLVLSHMQDWAYDEFKAWQKALEYADI